MTEFHFVAKIVNESSIFQKPVRETILNFIRSQSSTGGLRGVSSGTDTGTIRRIIRDAKTEVKVQIFQMETKPDPVDFPNRVTGLLFEQTDKILVAFENYYKQKGIRLVTRPDRIPDNLERACDKETLVEI